MNKHKLILLMLLIALYSSGARAGQITHTVTYDPSKLSITYDTINGTSYAVIDYEWLNSSGSESEPLLPCDVLNFSIPYNANNFSVQCHINSYVEFDVSGFVFPCQMPRVISDTIPWTITLPDTVIYQTDAYFPYSPCRAGEPYYLFGCNKVINLIVFPIKYNPVLNKIQLATSISIALNYDIDNSITPLMTSNNLELREKDRRQVQGCVINKMDVVDNEVPITINDPNTNMPLPTYYYCILTDKNLEPSFKKIIAQKRQKGLSAGTICVEDIVDSGLFPDGDEWSLEYSGDKDEDVDLIIDAITNAPYEVFHKSDVGAKLLLNHESIKVHNVPNHYKMPFYIDEEGPIEFTLIKNIVELE